MFDVCDSEHYFTKSLFYFIMTTKIKVCVSERSINELDSVFVTQLCIERSGVKQLLVHVHAVTSCFCVASVWMWTESWVARIILPSQATGRLTLDHPLSPHLYIAFI